VTSPCPCGLGADYEACCGRWHAGPLHLQAPDALALMRSRYCAYARELGAYLLDTWHVSTRPPAIGFEPGLRWLGLDVKRWSATGPDEAIVEFVARSKLGGRAHRLHETSRFLREAGHWYYLGAISEPPR
jgi:SEC-C motif-containing protein